MPTQSNMGLAQQVETASKFIGELVAKVKVQSVSEYQAEIAAKREELLAEIEGLKKDMPKPASKWYAIAQAELEARQAEVPEVPDDETAGLELNKRHEAMFKELAQSLVALLGMNEVTVPNRLLKRAAPLDVKVHQGRVMMNGEIVHAFTTRDGTVIVPHASSLPEGHEKRESGATLVGHLREGKFYCDRTFVEEFTSVSGLMKAILGDKAQGVNNTPFTVNDNARAGKVISADELKALVS